jgi:hypothetical protein
MSSPSRQAVVDALNTIPGVEATAAMPDTPTAGAAWPVWAEGRFGTGKLAQPISHTYEAIVVLPEGYHPDTVDAADGLVEQVMTALRRVGPVELSQPVQVVFDPHNSASMPGITTRVTVTVC